MVLRKFDKLLLTNFFPPMLVTFFIALFVLIMQTLWLYIDDIAGKGVGFFLMVELVGYLSVSMIPMALPVAVLISSVMVLGNLAERYELSSMKSAGVSLWRIMRPLMVVTLGIAFLSFICSNYFIPYSNLKFKSRLYDIRKQKPTLSMEESVFNDDFQGFNIRIGDKKPDNRTITGVLLYDDSYDNEGRLHSVVADSGVMYGTPDGKFFVMHLFNGNQYVMPKSKFEEGVRNYPLMKTSFKQWTKVFDLTEFNLDRTDENLFKSHHTMLSNHELQMAIDSIDKVVDERVILNSDQVDGYFYFLEEARKQRTFEEQRKKQEELEKTEQHAESEEQIPITDTSVSQSEASTEIEAPERPMTDEEFDQIAPEQGHVTTTSTVDAEGFDVQQPIARLDDPWPQNIDRDLKEYSSFALTFPPDKWPDMLEKARSSAKNIFDQVETTLLVINKTKETRVKHVFEYHSKFSMAIACFIFLFIGAPMGAIVRKGGFGWPLLISIGFFMLFVVITIFSKNIAERFVIDAILAAWMNCLIVFPMGLMLTYWALRDANIQQLAEYLKIRMPAPVKKNH